MHEVTSDGKSILELSSAGNVLARWQQAGIAYDDDRAVGVSQNALRDAAQK
jgi:hypothetical protein